MEWFRLYAEFATDSKVQMMSEAMQRRLMMLFCLRCSNTLETLQDDEIAFALRISVDDLAETKTLFLRKSFITETWGIRQWEDRQYASDSSTGRVRKHRNAKKTASETACNVPVTVQNRAETEQIQNRTETETESAVPAPRAPAAVDLSIALRAQGLQSQPADPRLIALAAQGVAVETVIAACGEAQRAKPGEKISLGYVLAIVQRWASEANGIKATGATPPARASPGYQTAAQQAKSFADRLTGRAENESDSRTIIDINPA